MTGSTFTRRTTPGHPVTAGTAPATWWALGQACLLAEVAVLIVAIRYLLGRPHQIGWFLLILVAALPLLLLGRHARRAAWAHVPGAYGLIRPGKQPWPPHQVDRVSLAVQGGVTVGLLVWLLSAPNGGRFAVVVICGYFLGGLGYFLVDAILRARLAGRQDDPWTVLRAARLVPWILGVAAARWGSPVPTDTMITAGICMAVGLVVAQLGDTVREMTRR